MHTSFLVFILLISQFNARLTFHPKVKASQLPSSYDWRQNNQQFGTAISTVFDQQDCGGCWAFSTVDVAGAWLQMSTKSTSESVNIPMSAQHELDCDTNTALYYGEEVTNEGCDGGFILTSYREIAWTLGAYEEQCQPFVGYQKKECSKQCGFIFKKDGTKHIKWQNGSNIFRPLDFWVYDYVADIDYPHSGQKRPPIEDEYHGYQLPLVTTEQVTDVFKEIIYTCGPSSATFTSCKSLQRYNMRSGQSINIYQEDDDSIEMMNQKNSSCGQHAVTIYGWGVQDSLEYWIVKNSWGSSFGDNGYFYIRAGKGDFNFEEEISTFCPKEVFSGERSGKDPEDFGFYEWVLRNGTKIDFMYDGSDEKPWVVNKVNGDLFSWSFMNFGLSRCAKAGIWATLAPICLDVTSMYHSQQTKTGAITHTTIVGMLEVPCAKNGAIQPVFDKFQSQPSAYHAIAWLMGNSVVYNERKQSQKLQESSIKEGSIENDTSLPQFRFVGDGFSLNSELSIMGNSFIFPQEYQWLADNGAAQRAQQIAVEIQNMLRTLCNSFYISYAEILSAIILMDRALIHVNGEESTQKLSPSNVLTVLLAAVVISRKMSSDYRTYNGQFAQFFGFNLSILNDAEICLLQLLGYNLNLNEKDLTLANSKFNFLIRSLV
ncbi:MAG: hypothetical protein EZS28_012237 [Streblomastix strix]|uniref:Peptidase C1A papain C-terminal domain-containing protein n=1 Tax=Streblomastix strix TaxID=222440 RepID=A0A5J4WBD1_9EUKA|nr:MAG: hypothetical protein EZS28_012237 [Streblomastix strix]